MRRTTCFSEFVQTPRRTSAGTDSPCVKKLEMNVLSLGAAENASSQSRTKMDLYKPRKGPRIKISRKANFCRIQERVYKRSN